MSCRRGFTIIELLVSVSVIALMASILLPVLSSSLAETRAVTCQSRQRQLAIASMSFAFDHNSRMPGIAGYNSSDVPNYQRSWVGSANSFSPGELLANAPQSGTLWDYAGKIEVYRCPALNTAAIGTGEGSNGKFDFALMAPFAGASFDMLPRHAMIDDEIVAAPLFVEEHPLYTINTSDIEGAHRNQDQLGDWHRRGRGNFVATDGSMHQILTPEDDRRLAWDWWALPPSGGRMGARYQSYYIQSGPYRGYTNLGFNLDLGTEGNGWGDWDHR